MFCAAFKATSERRAAWLPGSGNFRILWNWEDACRIRNREEAPNNGRQLVYAYVDAQSLTRFAASVPERDSVNSLSLALLGAFNGSITRTTLDETTRERLIGELRTRRIAKVLPARRRISSESCVLAERDRSVR